MEASMFVMFNMCVCVCACMYKGSLPKNPPTPKGVCQITIMQ